MVAAVGQASGASLWLTPGTIVRWPSDVGLLLLLLLPTHKQVRNTDPSCDPVDVCVPSRVQQSNDDDDDGYHVADSSRASTEWSASRFLALESR